MASSLRATTSAAKIGTYLPPNDFGFSCHVHGTTAELGEGFTNNAGNSWTSHAASGMLGGLTTLRVVKDQSTDELATKSYYQQLFRHIRQEKDV